MSGGPLHVVCCLPQQKHANARTVSSLNTCVRRLSARRVVAAPMVGNFRRSATPVAPSTQSMADTPGTVPMFPHTSIICCKCGASGASEPTWSMYFSRSSVQNEQSMKGHEKHGSRIAVSTLTQNFLYFPNRQARWGSRANMRLLAEYSNGDAHPAP